MINHKTDKIIGGRGLYGALFLNCHLSSVICHNRMLSGNNMALCENNMALSVDNMLIVIAYRLCMAKGTGRTIGSC